MYYISYMNSRTITQLGEFQETMRMIFLVERITGKGMRGYAVYVVAR